MVVLVGAYYFFEWQSDPPPKPASVPAPAQKTAGIKTPDAPAEAKPGQETVTKPPGPQWEHYTDDTERKEAVQKPDTATTAPGRADLAIIVDDMGSSMKEAKELAAIGLPVTFAIIPGLRSDREVAAFAASSGIEVMLHIPMQSKEYPKRRLEQNGLLLEYGDDEIKGRVQEYLTLIPQAVGANNHTGSAFTEDAGRMRLVLGILKQRGMFFVDSITTPQTTGPRVARELKMRLGKRDIFLDNEQDETYIRGQLSKAVERAKKSGHAIAICHPHPVTVATLVKALPELKQQGVRLVAASKIVR